jgi:hypothetical protein
MQAITSVGAYGAITAPPGQTYLLGRELVPLTGQTLRWSGSKLKLPNQVSTTLTGSAALSSAGANQTVVVPVTSATGFFVGQRVALEDQTVGGQKTISSALGLVTAAASGSVTVQFTNGIGDTMARTVVTATWAETSNTSYTFPAGAYLCSISRMIVANTSLAGIVVTDLEIDGNRANNTLGLRWETSPMIDIRAPQSKLADLWVHDAPTDAIYHAALGLSCDTIRIDKPGAMGFHIGDANGSTYGGKRSIMQKLWIDSPGMGTPHIGHYGGYTSSHPAYAALGFSRNTDHISISAAHLTNDSGVAGTTWGQAIGCITGGDNTALSFSDIWVRDFNKGIGAIQIVRSSGTPAAPNRIEFDGLRVESSGPTTPGTLNQWEVCSIGCSSGSSLPHTDEVIIRNADFVDSPLIVQDANAQLQHVKLGAAAVGNTSSLIIIGSALANCRVQLDDVESRRFEGVQTGAPAGSGYGNNIYVQFATVRGDNVRCWGGGSALRAQSGADVEISGYKSQNAYNAGALATSSNTRLVLNSPRVRLTSGFTANGPWAGIDLASGGGALGSGGYASIVNPDIEAVTNQTNQYAVRLCTTASVPNTVVGGKLKVSGTSTTPVFTGGQNGIVVNALLSHTFTPTGSEVATGCVVSANA